MADIRSGVFFNNNCYLLMNMLTLKLFSRKYTLDTKENCMDEVDV